MSPRQVHWGELLSFSVVAYSPEGGAVSVYAHSLPAGAVFENATSIGYVNQTFMWVPGSGQVGVWRLFFTATEDLSRTVECVEVTVTDENRPPEIEEVEEKAVEVGTTLSFPVVAYDPDGDAISLTSPNLPEGASLEESDTSALDTSLVKDFRWAPSFNQTGVYNVTFTASDWQNQTDLNIPISVLPEKHFLAAMPMAHLHNSSQDSLPATWTEHWLEHDQVLKRVYFDDVVAIYFDGDMSEDEASWLYRYMSDLVRYAITAYGDLHSDHVYAIFHRGKHQGGLPAYIHDPHSENKNLIDMGADSWSQAIDWSRDGIVHEVAHIVEATVHGKTNSPAFALWGDSKWAEFFTYAFYQETGREEDAQRVYDIFMNTTDDYPRPGAHWFRDWFYPLWRDYGGSSIMREFFNLVSLYWEDGEDMNWGEFVHFMSGAAREDLRALAAYAFGWTEEWEVMFRQARQEYPDLCSLYEESGGALEARAIAFDRLHSLL